MQPPLPEEEIQRRLAELDAEIDAAFRAQRNLPHPALLGCLLVPLVIAIIVAVVVALSWLGVIRN